MRVVVAEDAQLADAIGRLRGEWAELSGGQLEVIPSSSVPGEGKDFPEGDLIVFPSRHLGILCEESRLRPLRQGTLQSDSLAFSDFFPLVREREIVYGKRVMALPIGCPTPLLALAGGGKDRSAPDAWSQLTGAPARPAGDALTANHLQAYSLLCKVACYASHPARQAVLFDPKTMQPRLTDPPFVRAMSSFQDSGRAQDANEATQSEAIPWMLWPLRPRTTAAKGFRTGEALTIAPLPGAGQIYSPVSKGWEKVDGSPQKVTLLATSGRLVGVAATTRNATSAFQLAAWLAGAENARRLSMVSPGVANPRMSLALAPDDWVGTGVDGRQFAKALAISLQSRRGLLIPRILRVDDYLQALGVAVAEVEQGMKTPQEALEQAVETWEGITSEVGRDRQRQAYRRSLGLDEYRPAEG